MRDSEFDEALKEIGQVLASLRKRGSLSQGKVASGVSISHDLLSKLENGRQGTGETIRAVVGYLRKELEEAKNASWATEGKAELDEAETKLRRAGDRKRSGRTRMLPAGPSQGLEDAL